MRIRKFDEPVTAKYLLEWMDEFEEDPIKDGEFYLTKDQTIEWTQKLSDRSKEIITEWMAEESWEDVDYRDIGIEFDDDEVENDILKHFVDVVNKYDIKES